MTKTTLKHEVNITIDAPDAQIEAIATIVAAFYEEALLQVHDWHAVPTVHIIVTSDEATVKTMMKQLEATIPGDVSYRPAPYYLYEQ